MSFRRLLNNWTQKLWVRFDSVICDAADSSHGCILNVLLTAPLLHWTLLAYRRHKTQLLNFYLTQAESSSLPFIHESKSFYLFVRFSLSPDHLTCSKDANSELIALSTFKNRPSAQSYNLLLCAPSLFNVHDSVVSLCSTLVALFLFPTELK